MAEPRQSEPERPCWHITFQHGVGPLDFGMTLEEVEHALDRPGDTAWTRRPAGRPTISEVLFYNVGGRHATLTTYFHWGHLIQINLAPYTGPRVVCRDIELNGQPLGTTANRLAAALDTQPLYAAGGTAWFEFWSIALVPPISSWDHQLARRYRGWLPPAHDADIDELTHTMLAAPTAVRVCSFLAGLEVESFAIHRWDTKYHNSDL